MFVFLRFKGEVDNNIFENGSRYYVDKKHDNETRINICSLLNLERVEGIEPSPSGRKNFLKQFIMLQKITKRLGIVRVISVFVNA